MSGQVHIQETLPELGSNSHFYQNGDFRMLIDLSTGDIYATKFVFPNVPDIPDGIRSLFENLQGTELAYKNGGQLLIALNDFVLNHMDDLPEGHQQVVVSTGLDVGTEVVYKEKTFSVVAVIPSLTSDTNDDLIEISMPMRSNMIRTLYFYVDNWNDPKAEWWLVRVPRSEFQYVKGTFHIKFLPFDGMNLGQQAVSYFLLGAAVSGGMLGWSKAWKLPMLAIKVHNRSWLSWYNWSPFIGRAASDAVRIAGGAVGPSIRAMTSTLGITYAESNIALPALALSATVLNNVDDWENTVQFTRQVALDTGENAEAVVKKGGEIVKGAVNWVAGTAGGAGKSLIEGLTGSPGGGKAIVSAVVISLLLIGFFRASR